jgi:hypothetical protein
MKHYIFAIIILVLMCPFTAEAKGGRGGGKSHGSKATPRSHVTTPKATTPKATPKAAPKVTPAKPANKPTHVKQYVTKKGTVVAPHIRSAEDKTRANNFSTKGNTNPVTGKPGTKPVVKSVPKK